MKNTIDGKIRDKAQSPESYRIPEGYFEALPRRVFERIDREGIETTEAPQLPSTRRGKLFVFMRPYLYMAATFLIVTATFKLFEGQLRHAKQTQKDTFSHALSESEFASASPESSLEDFDLIYADLLRDEAEDQWLHKAYPVHY